MPNKNKLVDLFELDEPVSDSELDKAFSKDKSRELVDDAVAESLEKSDETTEKSLEKGVNKPQSRKKVKPRKFEIDLDADAYDSIWDTCL